jgi:hypothetical protein
MSLAVRFQETLRRLAAIDEGFVEDGPGLGLARPRPLDSRTAALLQVGVPVAIGSSAVCLERSAGIAGIWLVRGEADHDGDTGRRRPGRAGVGDPGR